MKKKCEGFPIGISILSRPWTGDCCDRVTRCLSGALSGSLCPLHWSPAPGFWRLSDSNRSSAEGLAWCTTTLRQWCRWTEGVQGHLQSGVRSGRAAPSPILYFLALEPLLCRLRDEGTNPALRGIPFAGPLTARGSAFADDITVFVSRHLDIEAVKKVVGEYERIAGAKVNFDKSEGLQLGA